MYGEIHHHSPHVLPALHGHMRHSHACSLPLMLLQDASMLEAFGKGASDDIAKAKDTLYQVGALGSREASLRDPLCVPCVCAFHERCV